MFDLFGTYVIRISQMFVELCWNIRMKRKTLYENPDKDNLAHLCDTQRYFEVLPGPTNTPLIKSGLYFTLSCARPKG